MKIIVLNFARHRRALNVLSIVAAALVIVLLCAVGVDAYMNSEGYVQAIAIQNEKSIIIIDAGHGGEDSGAIGVNGKYEKDLNLIIANEVGRLLTDAGFAVVYTRTEDKLLYTDDENVYGIRKISDLKNRCKIAAEYPNAIFVSIHMNSFGDSRYSGAQVYYSLENEESRKLADTIQSSIKDNVQPDNNRVIKKGEKMYILENIDNVAIIVECGFLTNSAECEKLSEKEYQKQLSLAIVYGIIEYKEANSSN